MNQGNFMNEKKMKIVKGYIDPLLPITKHEIIEFDKIAR
jgi:hypothetical protein